METWVNQSIRKLQFRHDFSVCRTSTAVTSTTNGTHTLLAVPSDFLRFRKEKPHVIDSHGNVYYLGVAAGVPQVERELGSVAGGEFEEEEINGPPKTIVLSEPSDVDNTRNFLVYPLSDGRSLYTTAPAGEYRIRIPYIRLLPTLTAGQSNWFTTNAEEFIVYAAASIGFFFNEDEKRGDIWQKRAAAEVQDILMRDKNEAWGGNTTLNVSFDALGPNVDFGDGGVYRGAGFSGGYF